VVRLPIALPDGVLGAQGATYRAPPAFHVQTHHYCYPDVGIEMPLGALPVVECNRWDPESPSSDRGIPVARADFQRSAAGVAYREAVAVWEGQRAFEAAEAEKAERLIAESMATAPDTACQVCAQFFHENELDIEMRCPGCRGGRLQPSKPPQTP
jgi:hypothetical protein